MTPASWQLCGMPYERAKCYGAPNWMAAYTVGLNYRLLGGARCMVCGRPATNAHHEPPKGIGGVKEWRLETPKGPRLLRPALIALCGSGTTGCHGMRHRNELAFRWEWDSEEEESLWWDGTFPSAMEDNDPRLYLHGRWVVESRGYEHERRLG